MDAAALQEELTRRKQAKREQELHLHEAMKLKARESKKFYRQLQSDQRTQKRKEDAIMLQRRNDRLAAKQLAFEERQASEKQRRILAAMDLAAKLETIAEERSALLRQELHEPSPIRSELSRDRRHIQMSEMTAAPCLRSAMRCRTPVSDPKPLDIETPLRAKTAELQRRADEEEQRSHARLVETIQKLEDQKRERKLQSRKSKEQHIELRQQARMLQEFEKQRDELFHREVQRRYVLHGVESNARRELEQEHRSAFPKLFALQRLHIRGIRKAAIVSILGEDELRQRDSAARRAELVAIEEAEKKAVAERRQHEITERARAVKQEKSNRMARWKTETRQLQDLRNREALHKRMERCHVAQPRVIDAEAIDRAIPEYYRQRIVDIIRERETDSLNDAPKNESDDLSEAGSSSVELPSRVSSSAGGDGRPEDTTSILTGTEDESASARPNDEEEGLKPAQDP